MKPVVRNLCSNSLPVGAESHHRLVAAARDTTPVSGLTHNFYKYPARFSPKFVRAVIELFSEPGDLILDPFMGGGTTLVEALALGRHAIGTDINSLAVFVAEVKTTLLDDRELAAMNRWKTRLPRRVNMCQRRTKTASLGRSESTSLSRVVRGSGRGSARGIAPLASAWSI